MAEVGAICDIRGHIQGRNKAGAWRTVQMQGCLLTMVWSLWGELIESSSLHVPCLLQTALMGVISVSLPLVSYICAFCLHSLPTFPLQGDFELLK